MFNPKKCTTTWVFVAALAIFTIAAPQAGAVDKYTIRVLGRSCSNNDYLYVQNSLACPHKGPKVGSYASRTLWRISKQPNGEVAIQATNSSLTCRGYLSTFQPSTSCTDGAVGILSNINNDRSLWYLSSENGGDNGNNIFFLNAAVRLNQCSISAQSDTYKYALYVNPSCDTVNASLSALLKPTTRFKVLLAGGTLAAKKPSITFDNFQKNTIGFEINFSINPPTYGANPVAYRVCVEAVLNPQVRSCSDYQTGAPFSGALFLTESDPIVYFVGINGYATTKLRLTTYGFRPIFTQTPIAKSSEFILDFGMFPLG